ncbi:MAG: hypothetical protein COB67_00280 [SAR324 cluster bacterium]|uniref:Thioredoxin domain-containing protein n=1 Tax=SAR324 cluster bacterium TaxID=2024889 RepID=A0A2A4TBD3_9DELT|nr:MAG: hypothetical protein COB67_00280 [SAR324 cluster bacterium]
MLKDTKARFTCALNKGVLFSALIVSLSLSSLSAKDKGHETGWNFYHDKNITTQDNIDPLRSPTSLKNANALKLLEAILKENQDQTKIQTKILAILQDSMDPQPKLITKKDGTKCIANSSADCYVSPKTVFAKSVPALGSWIDDPGNVEKAAVYSKWQAKHFSTTVFPMGYSLQFANEQFGTDANPLDYGQPGFDSATGAGGVLRNNRALKVANKHGKHYQLLIFLGKNIDADIYSFDNLGRLASGLTNVKITFVYYDKTNKMVADETAKWLPALKKGLSRSKSIVNKKAFDTYGIYTTPSVVAVIQKEGKVKAQTIATGRKGPGGYSERIKQFLKLEGIIKFGDEAGYKVWKEDSNYATKYIKNNYNIDLNQTLINSIKKNQKDNE